MLESISIAAMLLLLVCVDKLAGMAIKHTEKKGRREGIRRF